MYMLRKINTLDLYIINLYFVNKKIYLLYNWNRKIKTIYYNIGNVDYNQNVTFYFISKRFYLL